ncbi:hypothetical protein [Evansella cellulosilytica]|uniref:N-acetyltransferase domain-containing protein n=1 Tax=Evansella cellulosilytica (strain ATCC 21833 / DSM 2522 / FERM P-1141 / JCM 9156 / N-4) TaxID=649639 RepID=E6U0C5_EVAC2|nr:hypothetical protein [Evansella cellulosilytica]ADU30241.1 hypothetical protein Bcell_1979 [Evansella cellulosilytica DSM 2522]
MTYTPKALIDNKDEKKKSDIIEELEDLEFQMYRMRENIKEIAKRSQILGIEQTKEEKWVIVYIIDDGHVCKVMLHDCETPYLGKWDFSIHAQYKNNEIHIDDIRGAHNRGFGSVCMKFLKDHALNNNIQYITGEICERDWDHIDRLKHFYKKHHFAIEIQEKEKYGEIYWSPAV